MKSIQSEELIFIYCAEKYNPDRIIVETSGSAFPGKDKDIVR